MGHYCRLCGRSRPNEHFSGDGHRTHVCRECQKLDIQERQAIEALTEISDFLHRQSHISEKNLARLKELSTWQDPDVSQQAAVMLEVARVAPFKRRRFGRIHSSHPELWQRLLRVGLIWPTTREEAVWAAPEGTELCLEDDEAPD